MSLRLLHVIDSLDPAHGGPSVVCAALAAAQASLGHELAVVAYDTAGERPRIDALLAEMPGADFIDLDLLPRPRRPPGLRRAAASPRPLPRPTPPSSTAFGTASSWPVRPRPGGPPSPSAVMKIADISGLSRGR
jgi:hypothetical protein